MLCCRCQKVKFSRPYRPEENGRTADPLDVHTATIKYWNTKQIKHRELKYTASSTRKSVPDTKKRVIFFPCGT